MIKKPPALREGDTIAIVAPSSPFDQAAFQAGVSIIEGFGLKVILGNRVMSRNGYLAGTDSERLADFEEMILDRRPGAIIAARGGYGALRIIDSIRFELIQSHPKAIVGFSDVSVMLNTVSQRCSLITYHGPMAHSLSKVSPDSVASLRKALMSDDTAPIKWEQRNVVRGGVASGPLYGGNLTTLCHLIGTPFEPSFNGAILMLEDVNETYYKIDRMLTHLKLAGKLEQVKGILLGEFSGLKDVERIWERVVELAPPTVPIWGGMPFGHGEINYTWPIGATARFEGGDVVHFSVT